jgi:rSAM/selenodomain-associated transferase 2
LLSVIIPTLNEAANIRETIASICPHDRIEIIIVDGGSTDETIAIANELGINKIFVAKGRANQMNIGAKSARGEILLFLHADTKLPPAFDRSIVEVMSGKYSIPIAGAFNLQIDSPKLSLRVVEWLVKWRSRLFQMPYGDQAIFMTAQTWRSIGGFPELPIMEDFELMRRLKRQGSIVTIGPPVLTSARRWLHRGVIQTTIVNQIIIVGYLLGVSPTKLATWYRRQPRTSQNPDFSEKSGF